MKSGTLVIRDDTRGAVLAMLEITNDIKDWVLPKGESAWFIAEPAPAIRTGKAEWFGIYDLWGRLFYDGDIGIEGSGAAMIFNTTWVKKRSPISVPVMRVWRHAPIFSAPLTIEASTP